MKRILLYSHFDPQGIVEDYVEYALAQFKNEGFSIRFCTRSALPEKEKNKLSASVDEILAFPASLSEWDVWKSALAVYKNEITAADQLLLLNDLCYGPLFPLKEIFGRMQSADTDFWGLTERYADSPKTDPLASSFLCFPSQTFRSEAFWNFWNRLPNGSSSDDLSLSEILVQSGFRFARAIDLKDKRQDRYVQCTEPFSLRITDFIIFHFHLPFIPVKVFVHDYSLPCDVSGLVLRAVELSGSNYPQQYIYQHLNRLYPLSSQKNLPQSTCVFSKKDAGVKLAVTLKIAVICHAFLPEAMDELLPYLQNIPQPFDLLITTVSEQNKAIIQTRLQQFPHLKKQIIRVVVNHGRDVYPWLTAFRDIQDDYDVCLKLHSKKSSHQTAFHTFSWQHFIMESLLASPDYVVQLLNQFAEDPQLGILIPHIPPAVRLLAPYAIYENADLRDRWLEMLGLSNHGEEQLSVFSAGTMFWYRPKALQKLLHHDIPATLFPGEPFPIDRTMAHGLERAVAYIAHASGYTCKFVIPQDLLLDAFLIYEDRLSSVAHIFKEKPREKPKPQGNYSLTDLGKNLTFTV